MGTSNLWRHWGRTHDLHDLDALVRRYKAIVLLTASHAVRTLPAIMDMEDVISAGNIGLIKAIGRFDPSRGIQFETYAIAMIRGSILEAIRDADFLPRSVRSAIKRERRMEARYLDPISMEMALAGTGGEITLADTLIDSAEDIESRILRDWQTDVLKDAIAALPDRERIIIQRHYFNDVSLCGIARELGRSQSRVGQMHSQALGHLRTLLDPAQTAARS